MNRFPTLRKFPARCRALSSIVFLRLAAAQADDTIVDLHHLPAETPCFRVDRAELSGAHVERFGWLQRELDAVRGQCVGIGALQAIKRVLDARLIERGYTTSRVGFAEQDLASGVLQVRLDAGVVSAVRVEAAGDAPPAAWSELFAQPPGAPFELRRLEQGLELAERLPSQRVRVRIEPSTQPGGSVLVLERAPGTARRLHGAVRLDNGASSAHGRARAIAALALDQPSWRNDQLTLAASSNVRGLSPAQRAQSAALGYSVPWRGSLCEIDLMAQRTARRVQVRNVSFVNASYAEQWRGQWQWPLARNTTQRWRAHAALTRWHARGWVADEELDVQRRDTHVIELGTDGLQLYPRGQATWRAAWREGLNGASPGLAPVRALRLDAQRSARFGSWSAQLGATLQLGRRGMPDEERFAPGLPGFDSVHGPAADSGVSLRSELAHVLPMRGAWRAAAFVDLGIARLARQSHLLAGAALGLQARRDALSVELALAAPLAGADDPRSARDTLLRASATAHF